MCTHNLWAIDEICLIRFHKIYMLQIILAREYLKDVVISREQLKYLVLEALRGGCQVYTVKLIIKIRQVLHEFFFPFGYNIR